MHFFWLAALVLMPLIGLKALLVTGGAIDMALGGVNNSIVAARAGVKPEAVAS